jgi:hypothetical protein
MVSRNTILAALIVVIAVGLLYMLDPTLFGLLGRREGFEGGVVNSTGAASMTGEIPQPGAVGGGNYVNSVNSNKHLTAGQNNETNSPSVNGFTNENGEATEGFENLSPETMPFPSAKQPANCYPKNQLAPQELLPSDPNSKWAQVNPQASGDIAGKNFLNAGALIGVNTVGQSNRNANWDIRAAPPNPQVEVSPWLQSTIGADLDRRPLDIA